MRLVSDSNQLSRAVDQFCIVPKTSHAIFGSNAMHVKANKRCTDCQGSGRCEDCHGTGVNLRLNEAEPRCRGCLGSGQCAICGDAGSVHKAMADLPGAPVWLRA